MRDGAAWTRCGYRSEVARLEAVLIVRPPDSLASVPDPDASLMSAPVDLARMREQTAAICRAFEALGVEVHLHHPPPDAPPNVIFARDLFFATPEGAVLARMASEQRAGEERCAAAALASVGVPVLRSPTGTATFEGADALWIDRHTVIIGTGFRTNDAGADLVREVLLEQGVETIAVPLGEGVQHLLGAVTFVDERRAAVHRGAATPALTALLADRGYQLIEFEPDAELIEGRGMNVVTVAPGRVLMPAGNPGMAGRLRLAGVRVGEVDAGEYVKAAGGLGCLTGILRRGETT